MRGCDAAVPFPEPVVLVAADGYRLAAHRYRPAGVPLARLVVGGATGVSQRFYRRFAEYAQVRGFDTLTLDYRGIGESAPPTLRGFRMDYLDWARLDLAAAVEAHRDAALPLYLVGHSYGGHALGLLPNHTSVQGCVTFATGAGWHGWMPPAERLRVLLLWRLVLPPITRMAGYLPWSRLGMGEDLPFDVYRQWRRWCTYPNYFFGDPGLPDIKSTSEQVRTPIVAVNALDDAWALPRSRDAFMAAYRGAALQAVDIDPAAAGIGPIGHMGYFRPQASMLWAAALEWFERAPRTPPAANAFAINVARKG